LHESIIKIYILIVVITAIIAAVSLGTTTLASTGFKVWLGMPHQDLYPFEPSFGLVHRHDTPLTKLLIRAFNVWFRHMPTAEHPHPENCEQIPHTAHFLCYPSGQHVNAEFADVANTFTRLRNEYHRDGRNALGSVTIFEAARLSRLEASLGEMSTYLVSSPAALTYMLSIGPGCPHGEPLAQGGKWNPGDPNRVCFSVMIKVLHPHQ